MCVTGKKGQLQTNRNEFQCYEHIGLHFVRTRFYSLSRLMGQTQEPTESKCSEVNRFLRFCLYQLNEQKNSLLDVFEPKRRHFFQIIITKHNVCFKKQTRHIWIWSWIHISNTQLELNIYRRTCHKRELRTDNWWLQTSNSIIMESNWFTVGKNTQFANENANVKYLHVEKWLQSLWLSPSQCDLLNLYVFKSSFYYTIAININLSFINSK